MSCANARVVNQELERSINKEAQRCYRERARQATLSKSTASPEFAVARAEIQSPLATVIALLDEAVATFRERRPTYAPVIESEVLAANADPDSPASDTVRRAVHAFRDDLLNVLRRRGADTDTSGDLAALCKDSSRRGTKRFRRFLADFAFLRDLNHRA